MRTIEERRRHLARAFTNEQADLLAEVITEAYNDLIKVSDFTELKGVVKELAEAQKRTEHGLEELRGSVAELRGTVAELAEAQKRTEHGLEELRGTVAELAEAQKRTEHGLEELRGTVAELAEAQKRTEQGLEELRGVVQTLAEAQVQTAKEVRDLTRALRDTRRDLGGLTQSMGYAMENEAYRMLPHLLQERYGITLTRRLLRTQIGEEEINLFGEGMRNAQPILVVGEAKLRIPTRWRQEEPTLFEDLEEKVKAVKEAYPDQEIFALLITHFARPSFVEEAQQRGVAVIQSFEW